ncbi:hypothetical protein A9Q87_08580 [Flavobacteriales bacterium 34_180_T64]|nr:hypothetical protein A9Q87_08580 [Flavobacteriales bacterium 34_180_T64]
MYPSRAIEPENETSLVLIMKCEKQGYDVAMCSTANLTIKDGVINVFFSAFDRRSRLRKTIKKA